LSLSAPSRVLADQPSAGALRSRVLADQPSAGALRWRRGAAAAAAVALALSVVLAPGRAFADGDPYKQHWENGLKFFADKDYSAAEAEFQAAYDVRPNAGPLFNIAVCDKELFHYRQAIAALEKLLVVHGETMSADDKKAATDAIRDMRALLGSVSISVAPAGAKVSIDGEEVSIAQPVLVSPGKRTIVVRAEGYATAEQIVNVRSAHESAVSFALVAEKGAVTIEAPDPRMSISVDDQPVGQGRWSGLVAPGQHVVRMYGPDLPPIGVQILVAAGVPLKVTRDEGGVPITPPKIVEPPRRGFYVLGLGAMLFAATHPPSFPGTFKNPVTMMNETGTIDRPDFGAAYGLRAGYQVNNFAGFEGTFEHSSITTYENAGPLATDPAYYRIVANRLLVGMRMISPGSTVRFASSFGVGFTDDQILINMPKCNGMNQAQNLAVSAQCFLVLPTTSTGASNHTGIDAVLMVEALLEIDIDRVLLDFGAEFQLQSTGNLQAGNGAAVFGTTPLINGGPAFRFGYRFW
jgi:hypothetical protein